MEARAKQVVQMKQVICFTVGKIIPLYEYRTSKTPYVAIDERGLVRSIHLFLFSCVH